MPTRARIEPPMCDTPTSSSRAVPLAVRPIPQTIISPLCIRSFSQTTILSEPEAAQTVEETQTVVPVSPPPPNAVLDSFAVVHIGGHQYKVTHGDTVVTNRVLGPDIGTNIRLEKVLLIGTKDTTVIGTPVVENAYVEATVEEHSLAEKVIVFKKKRRKNYQRTNGFRQQVTALRIGHVVINLSEGDTYAYRFMQPHRNFFARAGKIPKLLIFVT
ncbi:hypothetical protein PROFUN_02557 [Planoprotostelium fungivorum]|uniref:Large ribosomal subunit protein bL21m n=1 Tax=Planoprotostelium fungivorum TaxID=1890364 RepID=A0A2P6MPA4_9EUKA|nr:hypothetical protein PROFUN_02557 [Planoprotostelium fungivorum]